MSADKHKHTQRARTLSLPHHLHVILCPDPFGYPAACIRPSPEHTLRDLTVLPTCEDLSPGCPISYCETSYRHVLHHASSRQQEAFCCCRRRCSLPQINIDSETRRYQRTAKPPPASSRYLKWSEEVYSTNQPAAWNKDWPWKRGRY